MPLVRINADESPRISFASRSGAVFPVGIGVGVSVGDPNGDRARIADADADADG
ncbi:MAG TPA: hypothetical protein VFH68_08955 [Polyangia bacterium]|nr:hypothetical protein [Polyangia bacterium]